MLSPLGQDLVLLEPSELLLLHDVVVSCLHIFVSLRLLAHDGREDHAVLGASGGVLHGAVRVV